MLDSSHDQCIIADQWDSVDSRVALPEVMRKGFFRPQGPMPVHRDSRRMHHRFYMRGKALLRRHGITIGAFTKDVSRQGVGFLSPVQLLPLERVELRVPSATLTVEVACCRRLEKGCFDCGARFVL